MSDNDLLEKVIVSTEIGAPGGSGLLAPEQANRFIDYMFEATVLGSQVRTIRMRSNEVEIDRIGVGERLMRPATEAVDTGVNAGVVFAKISLTTKKLRLDWELSSESLEDNLEGEALEDHIARMMATQAGNDLEDLAINGDITSTDPMLKAFNGWRKLAVDGNAEGAANIVDAAGASIGRGAFNSGLRAMPRNFMQRRGQLKWFVGSSLIQDYLFSLTEDQLYGASLGAAVVERGPVRTEGSAGFTAGNAFGIPLQEVPYFDTDMNYTVGTTTTPGHADVWLTFPQNLLWGVKREIQVFREFKPKKDTIEYTLYTRVGVNIENVNAFVVVKNIAAVQ